MTNDEKDKASSALREELRNERKHTATEFSEPGQSGTTSDSSVDGGRHDNNSTSQTGTSDQTLGSETKGTRRKDGRRREGKGVDDSSQRSVTEIVERQRQSDRRFGIDNSSFGEIATDSSGSYGTVASPIGRIVRTDGIPQRDFERQDQPIPAQPIPKRPGRPKNQSPTPATSVQDVVADQFKTVRLDQLPQQPKKERERPIFPWFKGETVLGKVESEQLREPLEAAIKDYAKYADHYLSYQSKKVEVVWSDLDDDEVKFLAGFLLKRGQTNTIAASTVRNVVLGNEYLALAMMLGPRGVRTYNVLNEERKKKVEAHPERQGLPGIRRSPFRSQR